VLTMISGARELMTPGAWEKNGVTYRLAPPTAAPPETVPDTIREQQLGVLRSALWQYARTHDGRFPADAAVSDIAAECWQLPGKSGLRYRYVAGLSIDEKPVPLAYEPGVFGAERWVLFTDGTVKRLSADELSQRLPEKP